MDSETTLTKRILLKINPALITELHGVVEACDYIAIVRTLDPDIAVVELLGTNDTYKLMRGLTNQLQKTFNADILTAE